MTRNLLQEEVSRRLTPRTVVEVFYILALPVERLATNLNPSCAFFFRLPLTQTVTASCPCVGLAIIDTFACGWFVGTAVQMSVSAAFPSLPSVAEFTAVTASDKCRVLSCGFVSL